MCIAHNIVPGIHRMGSYLYFSLSKLASGQMIFFIQTQHLGHKDAPLAWHIFSRIK